MLTLITLFTGLTLVTAGCGDTGSGGATRGISGGATTSAGQPSAPASAQRVDAATAARAFALLADLEAAKARGDCAAVADLTSWAAKTLGGRACEATRNGRPARAPADPVYLLPVAGDWFAVLAKTPDPAYYLFTKEEGRWRLAAGPVPVLSGEPPAQAATAEPDEALVRRARLVPQRHLTYLTDPAGVNGVRFPAKDRLHALRASLAEQAADVELLDSPPFHLPLADGSMLIFDALSVTRKKARELVVLGSVLSAGNKLTTVALARAGA
ncbi:hypothetical protein OIE66_34700 [Nonomuraea sp. NBC_01738]|uniref:hypothetical protein n=1 Tax=Nonomuraea sp. NBC_01738 TaxID=2976003 RepID=UPI002E0EF566|nr:hypothetical protein OIE66_34700 [Nonomuraea sp. NBC_01738]